MNLKELHVEFLKLEICQLRPKWCITMDSSSGMHSVCVCEIHQNCKLMATAFPSQVDYKMLLEKMAYDASNRNCMLRSCKNCSRTDELEKHLKQSFL